MKVAGMVRVHRRADFLAEVFSEMAQILVNVEDRGNAPLVIVCDKISGNVSQEIEKAIDRYHREIDLHLVEVKRPCHVWLGPLSTGLEAVRGLDATHCVQLDDDLVPSPAARRELIGYLRRWPETLMRLDALWLHCWDTSKIHANHFPPHWAPVAYRVLPEDEYSGDIVNHAPDKVARSTAFAQLKHCLLHKGYMTKDLRKRAWEASKAQGKIDAHTLSIVRAPNLMPIDSVPLAEKYYG